MTQPSPTLPPEAQAYLEQQIAEHDTYRAAGPIVTPSGALAYHTGGTIPASNVDADGRVALERHVCAQQTCGTVDGLCELHGQVTAWSDPEMAVLTEAGKKRQAAQKAAETRAAKATDKPAGTKES